jgi:lipopolysaccharide export LptBFGC system permease protein LptF
MQKKSEKLLCKIHISLTNGGIYLQRVRCGKSNCKCARGEKHTAYYYFTRVNGKLTRTYVRKSELKELTVLVDDAKLRRQQSRQAMKEANESIKETSRYLRENKDKLEKQKRDFFAQLIQDAIQPLSGNDAG